MQQQIELIYIRLILIIMNSFYENNISFQLCSIQRSFCDIIVILILLFPKILSWVSLTHESFPKSWLLKLSIGLLWTAFLITTLVATFSSHHLGRLARLPSTIFLVLSIPDPNFWYSEQIPMYLIYFYPRILHTSRGCNCY